MHTEEHQVLSLRPVTPEDEAFLHSLYGSVREDVQAWTCGEEESQAFLLMQYSMQDRFFRTNYPNADFTMIHDGGKCLGRIYVDRTPKEIRILDITLLPEYRGRGIGSMLLGWIIREAENARVPVRLMVERFSRARALYERLGFSIIEDTGTHFHMELDSQRNQ